MGKAAHHQHKQAVGRKSWFSSTPISSKTRKKAEREVFSSRVKVCSALPVLHLGPSKVPSYGELMNSRKDFHLNYTGI